MHTLSRNKIQETRCKKQGARAKFQDTKAKARNQWPTAKTGITALKGSKD